ncbi:MAG TPA: DUF58 domain-containing protein [Saprospiraceae bacterium]|nr:DUF58 domain-containing protein [Saprospiraceae bacterium]
MDIFESNDIRSLNNLELLANQVVEGFIIGLHKSPFHGFSVEFAEHRLYNQGESTKDIDWKVFARTDKLFSKRFEEETNLRCQIVLDTSSSMYFPEMEQSNGMPFNKLQFSILGAASMMNLLRRQRDAFGLTLFDQHIGQHTPAKSSVAHYKLLLTYLDKVYQDQQQGKKTSAAQSLHQIADSIHRRSLVMIFSDMFESEENIQDLFGALQHLKHNKHEVIVFHVHDRDKEVEFNYDNRPYLFIDLETGEKLRLQPKDVTQSYRQHMDKFIYDIKMKCLQYQIDFVEADIHAGYGPVLSSYLVKRARMRT